MSSTAAPTKNPHLLAWVDEMAKLTTPDKILWLDGSEQERQELIAQAVVDKVLIPLDQKK